MSSTSYPELHDRARLREVARLGVDREMPRDYLAELLERVAVELDMPFAVVTVLLSDAQVFLAGRGPMPEWIAEVGGTPIEWAFCVPMLRDRSGLCVSDFAADPAYRDNPLVSVEGLRAYIGAPVISAGGAVLGGICGLDVRPREFGQEQLSLVRELAAEVARRIEAHAASAPADTPPARPRPAPPPPTDAGPPAGGPALSVVPGALRAGWSGWW